MLLGLWMRSIDCDTYGVDPHRRSTLTLELVTGGELAYMRVSNGIRGSANSFNYHRFGPSKKRDLVNIERLIATCQW